MRGNEDDVPPPDTLLGKVLSLSMTTAGITLLPPEKPPKFATKTGAINGLHNDNNNNKSEENKKTLRGTMLPEQTNRKLGSMNASAMLQDDVYEDEDDEVGNAEGRVEVDGLEEWAKRKKVGAADGGEEKKDSIADADGEAWTTDLAALQRYSHLSPSSLLSLLENLSLPNSKITSLDQTSPELLAKLRGLDLRSNHVSDLASLPRGLIWFGCENNHLTSLKSLPALPNLMRLGLSYNSIDSLPTQLGRLCPSLVSLDLSFNCIVNLKPVLGACNGITELKQLYLSGNPVSLVEGYRRRVVAGIDGLGWLDEIEIAETERDDACAIIGDGELKEGEDGGMITIGVVVSNVSGVPTGEGGEDDVPGSKGGKGGGKKDKGKDKKGKKDGKGKGSKGEL